MKTVRRNRSYVAILQRYKFNLFLIVLIFVIILYKLSYNYKIVREKIKIVRGNSLKNFKNEEEKLNFTSNQSIFFIDDDPGDEKVLNDGRRACSVESVGECGGNFI